MNRDEFIKQFEDENFERVSVEDSEKWIAESAHSADPKLKMVIAMEELAELQKEISKYIRGEGDKYSIIEEIADVYICLDWLSILIPDITGKNLCTAYDIKLRREHERNQKDNDN